MAVLSPPARLSLPAERGCRNYFPSWWASGFFPRGRRCSFLVRLPAVMRFSRPRCRRGCITRILTVLTRFQISKGAALRSLLTATDRNLIPTAVRAW